jgi:hypothetical protein
MTTAHHDEAHKDGAGEQRLDGGGSGALVQLGR